MDVVLIQSICTFKSNMKHKIISTYSEKCVIPFCDSCKLLLKIHKYCLPIGMGYCEYSKKTFRLYNLCNEILLFICCLGFNCRVSSLGNYFCER